MKLKFELQYYEFSIKCSKYSTVLNSFKKS